MFPNPVDETDRVFSIEHPTTSNLRLACRACVSESGWLDLKKVDSTSQFSPEGIIQL